VIISEGTRLSNLSQASPPLPPAVYPESPEKLPGLPYRISSYLFYAVSGKPVSDITVRLADASGKMVMAQKKTDYEGKVYFDLPNDTQVILYPVPPETMNSSPPSILTSPIPISKVFGNAWDWKGDSVSFVLSDKIESGGKEDSGKEAPGGGISVSDILKIGGILLGGYILYRWLSSGGAQ